MSLPRFEVNFTLSLNLLVFYKYILLTLVLVAPPLDTRIKETRIDGFL